MKTRSSSIKDCYADVRDCPEDTALLEHPDLMHEDAPVSTQPTPPDLLSLV